MADVELVTLGATIKAALVNGNDGIGSGLDADLLDGKHANDFASAAEGDLAATALQPADVGTAALADTGDFATAAQGALADAALARAGGTMTGALTLGTGASITGGDKVASALELKDIAETVVAKGNLTGAVSYDYSSGGYQWGTTSGNITSIAITNPPASGRVGCLTLEIIQGGTARTIAWGAAFRFPGGTNATLTASAGAIDVFTLITRDGGSTWLVFEGGKAFAA